MYLIYAEVHLRYHKVNIYKFEGDSEMFDLWLSECAKYNAVISITANYPGTDRTCVTQNEGVVSQQNKLFTYTKKNKQIPRTRKWVWKTNLQHVNVTESQQKPTTCNKVEKETRCRIISLQKALKATIQKIVESCNLKMRTYLNFTSIQLHYTTWRKAW